jgi:hypothetical protein
MAFLVQSVTSEVEIIKEYENMVDLGKKGVKCL